MITGIALSLRQNVFKPQSDEMYTSLMVNDHDKMEIKFMYLSEPYTREQLANALIELGNFLLK